jgi:tetratricopeptide (TPR) repeat protein
VCPAERTDLEVQVSGTILNVKGQHAMIGRLLLVLVLCLAVSAALGQRGREVKLTQKKADTRTVVGVQNEYLAAGAEALAAKRYDEGIRLTILGLERPTLPRDRANALSNLCAAHAAKREPAIAIDYCTQSLEIDSRNWHAYSNRAYAYYLSLKFKEADDDLDRALALNPSARQMPQIRGMLNERRLRGRVTMEDHN